MAGKILVADDEQNIVISLEFLLRREGYQVKVAHDGNAALDAVRADPPDLAILDVMMPGRTGFDVCREIRADPALASVRVLILTARGRDAEVAKGLALGADAYMTKPFSTKDLIARVRALFQGA